MGCVPAVDGDTIGVRGTRVCLHGSHAPESAQGCRAGCRCWPFGREATPAIARRIGGRCVACEVRDWDG